VQVHLVYSFLFQDLATTSLPVSFNEPISILQRLAEDLEYSSLLDQAATTNDPVERVSLIAVFAISGYACTRIRAGRKPFNPMLGETFEDIRNNFIAEKVSHDPPVMACHASGQGWSYDAVTQAKQRVRLPPVPSQRLSKPY
jgi:oxysterol-binding protein-related protein 3/6/7